MNHAAVRSGMMLAAVPPSRMIPWTRAVGRSCCRQSPTDTNRLIMRVQRVLPLPRIRRGVGLEAGEHDVDVLRGQRVALDVAAVARVVEQGGVEPVEQPVLDHDRLAAAPLLGRRAEEHDLARQLIGDRGERDRGPDARCGHRVVPAAVAQARQGVVLGQDPDPGSGPAAPAAPDGADRGRRLPAGCSTANPCRARASATQPAALTSSNAGSGFPWIRWDRSRISGRAPFDGGREPLLGLRERFGRGWWW